VCAIALHRPPPEEGRAEADPLPPRLRLVTSSAVRS
jgi:hypothetical protein